MHVRVFLLFVNRLYIPFQKFEGLKHVTGDVPSSKSIIRAINNE